MKHYKQKKTGGRVDIHSLLPKIDMTPPGFRYLGANNPLHKQIQLDKLKFNEKTGEVFKNSIVINPGNEPKNELDVACLLHDCEYYFSETQKDILHFKHLADARLLEAMKHVKLNNFYQKAIEFIAKNVIRAKYKLGLGITMTDILKELENEKDLKSLENKLIEKGFLVK